VHMFFTFGSTLLSYTVAAFALSQRADLHSNTLSGFNPSAPEGFRVSVLPHTAFLGCQLTVTPAHPLVSMAPAVLLHQPTTALTVWFAVAYFTTKLIIYRLADRNSITVTFSKYFVRIGPGVPISSNRKDCQLTFRTKWFWRFRFLDP